LTIILFYSIIQIYDAYNIVCNQIKIKKKEVVTMARNFDKEFMDGLKNYMKSEWMKAGQQPWSKTVIQIATDLAHLFDEATSMSARGNKVWQYLGRLENSGAIKIQRGKEKGNPSWYTWLSDNINQELLEQREECLETIEEIAVEGNNFVQKVINKCADQSKQILDLRGELIHYKQAMVDLEFFSANPDGRQIFMVKKGSDLGSIVDQVKKEYEEKAQQESNEKNEENEKRQLS
jgi:hypothetical protein